MLEKHFEYDYWANTQWLDFANSGQYGSDDMRRLLAHIVGAQQVWLARLRQRPVDHTLIWPNWSLEQTRGQLYNMHSKWADLLAAHAQKLDQRLAYKNSKGKDFITAVGDILMHVISHGAYHRGQIARACRLAGGYPVNTDYITFVRAN